MGICGLVAFGCLRIEADEVGIAVLAELRRRLLAEEFDECVVSGSDRRSARPLGYETLFSLPEVHDGLRWGGSLMLLISQMYTEPRKNCGASEYDAISQ